MMNDISQILNAVVQGDPEAASRLLPLVYDELRRLAAVKLAREQPGQTLDATALVHEAYLRLVGDGEASAQGQHWDGRGHFFAAAAEAMRRILVERARRRQRVRHGGGRRRLDLVHLDAAQLTLADDIDVADELSGASDLLAIDEALGRLAPHEPQAAEVVKLRYF